MKLSEPEIVHKLLAVDDEFQTLHRNHQDLKEKLAEFDRKTYLSTKEQLEVKRLKKQKLLGKDRMYAKIHEFKRGHVGGAVKT